MSRSSNIFTRIEPEVKKQAEIVLNALGIPMSSAITMFLRQVILQKGLPFDVKLPASAVPIFGELSKKEFDAEIGKGMADYKAGNTQTVDEAFADIERETGA